MDLALDSETRAFQQEVRAFLDEQLTPDIREATEKTTTVWVDKDVVMEWHRRLYRKGWVGYFWPKEYGGTGWSPTQQYIFLQECAQASAPRLIPMGLRYVGPVIFTFGTQEQKDTFLPKILSGEHYWCQGYSEPGAGSDLASLKMRAVRDGDEYVLNGSKIWTTNAHMADWIFCLVRTDNSGKKQEGITFVLVDMKTPGIKVDPIITLGLDHEVNQVFFDDVRIPVSNRVGDEGQGWSYGKFLLEFERAGGASGEYKAAIRKLKAIAGSQINGQQSLLRDPHFETEIAKLEIGVMGLEMTERRVMSRVAAGQRPGPEGSVLSATGVEINQRISELAVEAMDYYAAPLPPPDPTGIANDDNYPGPGYGAPVMGRYLNKRAASIYGGAKEIQREIISKAVLHL
ncbi:MAG: acyl-CoA dehydrogenase [Alphaproteobacteria bacterium]|nr:acyl-CoA dehydrogenase [Alphaproteobacteria bacterium]